MLKRFLLSLLLVSFLPLVMSGVLLAEEEELKAPRLKIEDTVYDFGSVEQGKSVEYDFVLKNEGDAPLEITRVVPSCGCTATKLSADKIEPGETATVHAVFDTTGFSGNKIKTIRLYTTDLENNTVVLSLKGEIIPEVTVSPKRIIFGNLIYGEDAEKNKQEVTVKVREGSGVTLGALESRSKFLEVEELSSDKTQKRFTVGVKPDAGIGELRERIVVFLKGSKRRAVNIPIFASIQGGLKFKPSALAFGVLGGQNKLSRTVKLTNRGDDKISIKGLNSRHPAVTGTVKALKEGRSYLITVTVDPKKVKRDLRASLDIYTDSEEQSEVSLSVYGILPPKL